mgnify:CR=1 FL=1
MEKKKRLQLLAFKVDQMDLSKKKITNTTGLQLLNKQFYQEPYVPPRLGIFPYNWADI